MVTSAQCLKKWGDPTVTTNELKYMTVWDVPAHLEIGVIPKKLYCNKEMIGPLMQALSNIIDRGLVDKLKTFDGCFNVRIIRGYEKKYASLIKQGKLEEASKLLSLHSWGIAIDINAAWNGLGKTPTMSAKLVKCFTDAGFEWGGTWTRKDGMHFQLNRI